MGKDAPSLLSITLITCVTRIIHILDQDNQKRYDQGLH